jgi:hypothetical protein
MWQSHLKIYLLMCVGNSKVSHEDLEELVSRGEVVQPWTSHTSNWLSNDVTFLQKKQIHDNRISATNNVRCRALLSTRYVNKIKSATSAEAKRLTNKALNLFSEFKSDQIPRICESNNQEGNDPISPVEYLFRDREHMSPKRWIRESLYDPVEFQGFCFEICNTLSGKLFDEFHEFIDTKEIEVWLDSKSTRAIQNFKNWIRSKSRPEYDVVKYNELEDKMSKASNMMMQGHELAKYLVENHHDDLKVLFHETDDFLKKCLDVVDRKKRKQDDMTIAKEVFPEESRTEADNQIAKIMNHDTGIFGDTLKQNLEKQSFDPVASRQFLEERESQDRRYQHWENFLRFGLFALIAFLAMLILGIAGLVYICIKRKPEKEEDGGDEEKLQAEIFLDNHGRRRPPEIQTEF